jgi:WD40 repeat protein
MIEEGKKRSDGQYRSWGFSDRASAHEEKYNTKEEKRVLHPAVPNRESVNFIPSSIANMISPALSEIDFEEDIERLTKDFTGREQVFNEIDRWLKDRDESFFILIGEPGMGKSAITAQLIKTSREIKAYNFCISGNGSTITPKTVLRSLATQLGKTLEDYGKALANTVSPIRLSVEVKLEVQKMTGGRAVGVVIKNLYPSDPEDELDILLRQPLHRLQSETPISQDSQPKADAQKNRGFLSRVKGLATLLGSKKQPVKNSTSPARILIVFDSLDEAVTFGETKNLVTLLSKANDLPSSVRFFCTTRPERRVLSYLEYLNVYKYHLNQKPENNFNDLHQYIKKRVECQAVQNKLQEAGITSKKFIERLIERSQGNFLYTQSLLNDLEFNEQILNNLDSLPKNLEDVYHQFFRRFTEKEWQAFQPIFGVLAVAKELLSQKQLSDFTGIEREELRQSMRLVSQFLVNKDRNGHEYHRLDNQSLRDYLLNEKRNKDFWCNPEKYHKKIADFYSKKHKLEFKKTFEESYFWNYFAYHMSQAGQQNELRLRLLDFEWLQAKLEATDINALISDYDLLSNDKDLNLVQGAMRLSADILAKDKKQLAGQLLGRLLSFERPAIQSLRKQIEQWKAAPWLRPLFPSLTPPGGALLRTFGGHNNRINAVALIPERNQVISALDDGTLKLWNLNNSECQLTFKGHSNSVRAVAITPDNKYALSGSDDCTLRLWNLDTGRYERTFQGHTKSVSAVDVAPNGQFAVSASYDRTLRLWDLSNGTCKQILQGHQNLVNAVVITSDGKKAISASRTLKLWDLNTGKCQLTLEGHDDSVNAVAIVSGSNRVIFASNDQTLRLWDLDTEECQTLRDDRGENHSGFVRAVAVTSDGQFAISASFDSTLKLWNLNSGRCELSCEGHGEWFNAVAITPRGDRAISGSYSGTLKLWNLSKNEHHLSLKKHDRQVNALAITPDGQLVISASDDHTLKLWNLTTGECQHTFEGHTSTVKAVAVTPNGKFIVSGSSDKTLKLWDLTTGELQHTFGEHTSAVMAVAVTPDGKKVISASLDRTLKLWDLATGKRQHTLEEHTDNVIAVAIMPNGQSAISGSTDGTLKLWDLMTGRCLRTLEYGSNPISAAAVTPDGKNAISGEWNIPDSKNEISFALNSCVKFWDLTTGHKQPKFKNQQDFISDITVTPNGNLAIWASEDKTLKIGDLKSNRLIASFSGESSLTSCTVSSDGVTIIVGEKSGLLHFLRLEGLG